MYWFVEAVKDWRTKEKIRYEYLEYDQAVALYEQMYDQGAPLVRKGMM